MAYSALMNGLPLRRLLAQLAVGVPAMLGFGPGRVQAQFTHRLERSDSHLRPEVELDLAKAVDPNKETTYARYACALTDPLNAKHGGLFFEQLKPPGFYLKMGHLRVHFFIFLWPKLSCCLNHLTTTILF